MSDIDDMGLHSEPINDRKPYSSWKTFETTIFPRIFFEKKIDKVVSSLCALFVGGIK